jgi:hypothetical protein
MCFDPVSMAVVATAASVAGSAISGISALQQGNAAQAAANWNAEATRVKAGDRLQSAGREAANLQTRQRLMRGEAMAQAGGSGVEIEGSPLEALAFNAGQQALDLDTINRQGLSDSRDLLAEAELMRWQGKTAKQQSRGQALASFARAGTSLLTSAGSWGGGAKATPNTIGGATAPGLQFP